MGSGVGDGHTVQIMNMVRGWRKTQAQEEQSWEQTNHESKEPRTSARSTGARAR